jgi:Ni/Fe-hydrogenase 1 B-type cytochrome subunit
MSHEGHYRQAHPLIFVFTHAINLVCMIGLAFTGFYIHYPFFAGFMYGARTIHFVLMFVLVINLTSRIILAFWVQTANQMGTRKTDVDIKNWLPQEENKHQFWETVKYYTFFRNTHVISGKYGSLQKISYLATVPITFYMAWTGFALYTPAHAWAIWPVFGSAAYVFGSDMGVRIAHYFGMWVIILFTMVHAYLAAMDGFKPLWGLIFLWKETPGDEA